MKQCKMRSFEPACVPSGSDLLYEGEIFRAGCYLDRGVIAEPEDLVRMAERVGTIPARVQHVATAFDAALRGYGLERVEARDGGAWLWGRARFPSWLRDALGGRLAVSVGLRKRGLRPVSIEEVSIVNEGRVPTAVLAAAFAVTTTQARNEMNLLQKFAAYFGAHPEALEGSGATVEEVTAALCADTTIDPEVEARLEAAEARHAEMQARIEAQNAVLLGQRAEEFARGAVRERKALPAEEEDLRGLFVMAARADGYGMATFGLDGRLIEGENVALLRRSVERRKTLALFDAVLSDRSVETLEERAAAINRGALAAYGRKQ